MEETFMLWHSGPDCVMAFNHKPNTNMVKILPSMTDGEKRDAARYPFINCSSLKVMFVYEGKQYEFRIPKGFRWDGATIPSLVWFLVGSKTENRYRIPSLIHDYLCNNKYVIDFNRKASSVALRALLRENGVAEWRVFLMYLFVEIFQWFNKEWLR